VHKHRNLLSHAPERLREEVSADYNDMIYATSAAEIGKKRKVFLRKWRLRCQAVADCLEEAGDRLFTFTKLPASQWKSARATNAIERLHEEFKRRIKTQTMLPSAETAAMMFWALVASGQISMRKVDGWNTLAAKPADLPIPRRLISYVQSAGDRAKSNSNTHRDATGTGPAGSAIRQFHRARRPSPRSRGRARRSSAAPASTRAFCFTLAGRTHSSPTDVPRTLPGQRSRLR
jgi:hypothetical protein